MKLDIDTFFTYLAALSGAFACVIVCFNALLYGMFDDIDPSPKTMFMTLVMFTVCLLSLIAKAIVN